MCNAPDRPVFAPTSLRKCDPQTPKCVVPRSPATLQACSTRADCQNDGFSAPRKCSSAACLAQTTPPAAVADLFRRCLDGNDDASWRAWLERYEADFHRILFRQLKALGLDASKESIEELAQDVFLAWLKPGSRFHARTEAGFWKFVHASARNAALNALRRHRALKRRPAAPRRCFQSGPLQTSLRRECYRRLWRNCLAVTHPESRSLEGQALALTVFMGYSSRETSHQLRNRLPHQRVDALVRRLRRRLARQGLSLPRRC